MRKTWIILLALLLALALGLAACGGDDDDSNGTDSATNGDATNGDAANDDSGAGGFNPGGADVSFGADLGADSDLPGCADPDDEECPAALDMPLDGEAVAEGVQISYPDRYFDALTGDDVLEDAPPGTLIQIVPSENNRYAETAVFSLYFGDSVAGAVAALAESDAADWTTETLTGTIAVHRDETLDPPVNRTIGAFEDDAGRVVVLELVTTGKYGWDLWARVYTAMLDSVVLAAE